ncbi:MAG: hypothetical protein RLZ35_312 [Pseudomonadota bacterium]|jgi:hypothetical protein
MTIVHRVSPLVNSHKVLFQDKLESSSNFLKSISSGSLTKNLGLHGGSCVRVAYVPNNIGSPRLAAYVAINDTNRVEYTLEYYLFFEEGFEWVKGGKLPGLRGGPLSVTTTGCVKPQPTNAWSYRLMWKRDGNVCLYIYDQTRITTNADCGIVTQTTAPVFQIGKWHRIQIYMKLNSGANKPDGTAELWLDNKLILKRTEIPFRGDENATIDHVCFSSFYGGNDATWAPSKTTYIRFDNFTLYKGKAINIAAG